ncbi:MAG: aminotransferase class I/II-fold pyridoxal phosphate-dependent enzyme [Eubacteriales bacterium]
MTEGELERELAALRQEYERCATLGLKLDMSRGKPGADQLTLTQDMLGVISTPQDCITENGLDCRNYGLLDGIPEAKRIFSDLLGIPMQNIIVGGNSSLNMMYDSVARAMLYGVYGSVKPWGKYDKIKFLCPAPGYDRHFAICQSLGIEMITVPMTSDGPDMDMVERLAASDETVKGIWCVPKYSNPDGIIYSDETVRRFARLKTAAKDFRIFWDNAYCVHDIYGEGVSLLNLFNEAAAAGNPDIIMEFASTSKISFPGSGVAVMCASDNNLRQIKSIMTIQTIGFDKLNQMRHVKYFGSADGIRSHMKLHADILRPKFDAVLAAFREKLAPLGIAEWIEPKGGYFISLNLLDGTAKRTYELCSKLGVTLTTAGATFPYGIDPRDRNLRIAPSYPTPQELTEAVEILCLCSKIACAEKLIG